MEISTRLAFSLPRASLGHLSNGQEFIFALLSENERVLRDNVQLKKSLEQMAEERDFWKSRRQELESRLNTNSTNSNRPPSTDPPFVRQAESGTTSEVTENTEDQERPKKRPYHRGVSQPQLTPTDVQFCEPHVCPHCGGTHFDDLTECSRFQHIEIPEFFLIVTLFCIFSGRCSHCHKIVKGAIPQEFQSSYGSRLSAFIVYLASEAAMPRRQIQKLLKDTFGIEISQGGIQNIIDRASDAIEPLYTAIAESVRKSPACHVDETSWPTHGQLGKHLHWLWFMGCSLLAFFMVDPHRSKKAFEKLIGEWKGILISDDYMIYQKWEGDRQTCLAHLKREILKCKQSKDPLERKLGELSGSILKTICDMSSESTTLREIWALKSRIVRLARRFGQLKGKAGAFARRLEQNFEDLWLFVVEPRVDKTNNFAERQIRTAVCHRKISFGSSAEKGERWIERSLSLRKTCALQGKSYYSVLVECIERSMRKIRQRTYWIRKAIWSQFSAWTYGIDCNPTANRSAL